MKCKLSSRKKGYGSFPPTKCAVSVFFADKFSGTASEVVAFSTKLKAFKKGELKVEAVDFQRKREGKFPEVEGKIIDYLKLRAKSFAKDKLGVSFLFLKEKAMMFAQQLGVEGFSASTGWLTNTLKRAGLVGVKLHGEGMDIPHSHLSLKLISWLN